MKKIFSVLLYIYSSHLFAQQTPDCDFAALLDSDNEAIATSFQIPNCSRGVIIEQSNNANYICACKAQFERSVSHYPGLGSPPPRPSAKTFIINELKKALSSNILDMAKLRTMYSTGADFSSASTACDISQIERPSCVAPEEFQGFKDSMVRELAQFLSPTPSFNNDGILQRASSVSTCTDISDQDVIRASSLLLEESISSDTRTPNFVEQISNLNPVTPQAINSILRSYTTPDYDSLSKTHPVLSRLMLNPADFKTFFSSLQRPTTLESFKDGLYRNPSNNQKLVQNVANACTQAIRAFKDNVCLQAVTNNQVKIDRIQIPNPYSNLSSSKAGNFMRPAPVETARERVADMANFLQFCDIRSPNPTALDLNRVLTEISSSMNPEYSAKQIVNYGKDRYSNEIAANRALMCEARSEANCTASSTTVKCKLYNSFTNSRVAGTSEYRLANTSDSSLNSLLRAMIGNPTAANLPPDIARILIDQRIIPQTDGTILAQEDIDRSPRAISTPTLSRSLSTSGLSPGSVATAARRATISKSGATRGSTAADDNSDLIDLDNSRQRISDEFAALPPDSQTKLSGIQDEIMRRVTGQPRGGRPLTADQIRRIVREEAQNRSVPLSAAEENAAVAQAQLNMPGMLTPASDARTAGLGRDVDGQVWRSKAQTQADRANGALMGMASGTGGSGGGGGASGSAGGGAAGNAGRGVATDSATIALDVSADAGANITDALNSQFRSETPGAQQLQTLLRAQSNFNFRFRDRTVQVLYDRSSRSYRVSETAGLAPQLKSQLESFLNNRARLDDLRDAVSRN